MGRAVRVLKAVYGGDMLARDEGALFVRGALPGELVTVAVRERKKDHAFADVVDVVEASPHRVAAPCPVYGLCGGCQLQHADYGCQLALKTQALSDVLSRIGKLAVPAPAVHGSAPFHYRYRGQFKAGEGRIGFYKAASRELVPVPAHGCPLMIAPINDLLPLCSEAARATGTREVHVACNGRERLVYLKGPRCDPSALEEFAGRGADGIRCDAGGLGPGSIAFGIGDLVYNVSARSFFQANWELNLSLIEQVVTVAGRIPGGRVLDLYAGAGNFSLPLAAAAAEVVAVEGDPGSFSDLRKNIAANALGNCRAVRSRVESFRPGIKGYDAVIVDPPREGLSDRAFRILRAVSAPMLLYVSCSPPTLARDLAKLRASGYVVESLDLYDFFPNTYHVETLAVLSRPK